MQCPTRIPRPVKYTHVQIKILRCDPVRSSLHNLKDFFCNDATELIGQFGIIGAEYSRISGFASRPGNRSRSVILFVIFHRSSVII